MRFEATTTPKSERLLADTLGYPETWHVVRKTNSENDGVQTFFDTIYAGDPKSNSDIYYNHRAAMDASTKWVEGESTPYDDDGGQMLPIEQTVEILAGDEVEVYYEPDCAWYAAVVKKVTKYKDDTRYSVKYKADRSTQDNVFLDIIRFVKSGKRKAKKKAAGGKKETKDSDNATKGKGKAETTPKSNKRKNAKGKTSASAKKKRKTKAKEEYIPDVEGLHVAAEMGLPEGWTAFAKSKSRFTFLSPDGTERFTSKTAVFDHIDNLIDTTSQEVPIASESLPAEGEDPPWRTDGHKFLQKRVNCQNSAGGMDEGTITGWISAEDLDKDGNPGFISERDGIPAALFHVTFHSGTNVASQDLEEFELIDVLVDEE